MLFIHREPVENLECADLIEEFEEKEDKIVEHDQVKKSAKKNPPKAATSTHKRSTNKTNQTIANQKTGFDEGLTVESILGATDASGELMFLIKWWVLFHVILCDFSYLIIVI